MKFSDRGAAAALLSAVLFGASAPFAKRLLGDTNPWLLAGLLYTASGLALGAWRLLKHAPRPRLRRKDILPLSGAIIAGGMGGPVLLMLGLSHMPASGASLLLNAEALFTAAIAWIIFHEHVDRRILLGFTAILAGALVLSWPGQASFAGIGPTLALLGACLCWGIDNNLTRQVSLTDATWLAAAKGLVAGPVNLIVALGFMHASLPGIPAIAGAAVLGVLCYGVSLVLFIIGMRHIGTARAGAYFCVAPFFGTVLAVIMGERPTITLFIAGALMAVGVWLHLTESHNHLHTHEPLTHEHFHSHDEHHDHEHPELVAAGIDVSKVRHRHEHTHTPLTHTHKHFPDAHHRHAHPKAEPIRG
ncbi:MAG: DMT family transporter [Propionibacteriaceae bacterium]